MTTCGEEFLSLAFSVSSFCRVKTDICSDQQASGIRQPDIMFSHGELFKAMNLSFDVCEDNMYGDHDTGQDVLSTAHSFMT